jgi:Ca2+-binding EF-hand superfamily protein
MHIKDKKMSHAQNENYSYSNKLSSWDRVLCNTIQSFHNNGNHEATVHKIKVALLKKSEYALNIADGLDGKEDGKINKIALISAISTLTKAKMLPADLASAMLETLKQGYFPHSLNVKKSYEILHANIARRLQSIDLNKDGIITPHELGYWLHMRPLLEQEAQKKKEIEDLKNAATMQVMKKGNYYRADPGIKKPF